MKPSATIRTALALFAFGLSLSLTAVAAPNACAICEANYQYCLDANVHTDQQCTTHFLGCMRRGDGRHPCPL